MRSLELLPALVRIQLNSVWIGMSGSACSHYEVELMLKALAYET